MTYSNMAHFHNKTVVCAIQAVKITYLVWIISCISLDRIFWPIDFIESFIHVNKQCISVRFSSSLPWLPHLPAEPPLSPGSFPVHLFFCDPLSSVRAACISECGFVMSCFSLLLVHIFPSPGHVPQFSLRNTTTW